MQRWAVLYRVSEVTGHTKHKQMLRAALLAAAAAAAAAAVLPLMGMLTDL